MEHKDRCKWCNLKNPKYIAYHDEEWCQQNFDDSYLYEMLILESFQAGLSWECVLNKRESFRIAYDNFDLEKVCSYDDEKITELLNNQDIIRNQLKIKASINNSKVFKVILGEYGSFHNYLRTFAGDKIIYETDKITNDLSDAISIDLQKRGMKKVLMVKSLRFICSLILLLVLSPIFKMNVAAEDSDRVKLNAGSEIEQYVAKHMDTTAGMSVAVFDENETIYRNYFGYMDVENEIPVTKDTVMEWGSVSKILVWVSVMQLVEQDIIDLETDITTYLPEGFLQNRTYDAPITMLNLMNHNAGFEESIIGMATGREERIISLEEYLLKFQPKQVFEPGTVCAYSNWGTALAAYIVEHVSDIPYYEYVRKNIFEPLEMNDTSLCADLSDNEDVKERRKALKIYTIEVEEITPNMSYIVMYPAGMCISTIEDMQKFAQSLLSENTILFQEKDTYLELFSPSLYFEGTENPRNYHGFWSLESYGNKIIGHGGNTAGCSSSLLLDMENQVGMVVQTNQYVEEIYNHQMPELLFGTYQGTASGYTGLIMAARTIFHGPLKLYRLLSVYSVKNEEPAASYDVRTNEYGIDRISCPYGDYFVIGIGDIAMDIIVLGLYLISICYCLINLIICLIKTVLDKIKGKSEEKVLGLWCMISSVLPLVMVVIFVLMLPTFFNFQQWSVFTYRISFLLIFLSALAMLILITYGFVKLKNSTMKRTRKLYVFSINICMIVTVLNIFYWNWSMFWMI